MKDSDVVHHSAVKSLFPAFLDAVFPPKCLVCGTLEGMRPSQDADNGASALRALGLCKPCEAQLLPIQSPFCPQCGVPFVSRQGPDHHCEACLTETRVFRKARSFGAYRGTLMKAIQVLKYGKKAAVSRPLSRRVRDCFDRHWERDEVDLLLAVPLHGKRLRERGFNQAHLLISRWAREQGLSLDDSLLLRHRMTQPQTGLTLPARKRNVKGAFVVQKPESVKGRRILLIDDVYTTGATVSECARVLMNAQAEYVDVLTLARAL